jgi:hypothetical protein
MATVIGHSTALARNPNTGIDWLMVVNGEQGFTLRRPLKGQDAVIGRTRIVEVIDKGPGKGALLLLERNITDKATGDQIGAVTQTIFCRGDGGFGGPPREAPPPHAIPARAPDAVCDLGTRPEMALTLSAQRRLQSAACRACVCEGGRISAPDFARARDVRRVRSRAPENHVRLRSRTTRLVRLPLFRAGLPGAKPSAQRFGATPISSAFAPARWNAMSSPSTTAAPRYAHD